MALAAMQYAVLDEDRNWHTAQWQPLKDKPLSVCSSAVALQVVAQS